MEGDLAQVTIYLPDEVEAQVKRAAKKAHKSLSAYLTELATRGSRGPEWPKGFVDLYGSWEGEFPDVADAAPEEPEAL